MHGEAMNESNDIHAPNSVVDEQWWVAAVGDMLVWARVQVMDSGTARVFDCNGETVSYDSEDSARASLLDADYRAWDGLDEDDAADMGFDLNAVSPPSGDDDSLREQMFSKLSRRQ